MASMTKMTGKVRTDPKTGRQLKPTVSYKVRWYYPLPDGKAEEQTVTWRDYNDAKTLKAIIEARGGRVRKTDPDVLDHSIVTGKPTRVDQDIAEKPFGLTIPEVIQEMIADKVRNGIKESTLGPYRSRTKVVAGFWADEYVSQIDEDKCRALLDHVTDDLNMAPQAVMQFAGSVLNYAVNKGYLSRNPLRLIKVDSQPKRRPRFLAREEFEILLSYVNDDEFHLLMRVAWETGLRQGEICALERDDIAILNGKAYITVSKTVAANKDGKLHTHSPKSGKERTVVCPLDLANELLEPGRHPSRIFPARRNANKLLRPRWVGWKFDQVRNMARAGKGEGGKLTGRRPVFHDLRHSHASGLLGAGVDMFVVSKHLGHSSIKITVDTYGHLQKSAEDTILAAVARNRPVNVTGQYAPEAMPDAA